jgi:TP901 family phage tail tape measure protein
MGGMGLPKAAATIAITGDPEGLEKAIARSKGLLSKFASGAKSILGGAGGIIGGALGKVGSFLARSLDPLGRAYSLITDQVGDVMDFEKGVARLAISQGKTNEQMSGFRAEIGQVSDATGVARNDILKGAAAYQALTGDTAGAGKAMSTFARVAQATGSTVEDIATTSAALSQNLKIDPADLEKAFSILNVQGKAGAIELHDLAGLTASLAAGFQQFKGGSGISGLQEMGAAAQIIRRNFGSAGEAATGFQGLMTAIVKNAAKLQAAGVKVFDRNPKTGKKHLRDFASIVESIGKSSLMRDPTKLAKALGRDEARKALQALTNNWGDFKNLVDTTDFKSIGKDMNQYLQSPAGKLEKTWNAMKNAIAEAFTPERIARFADALDKVAKAAKPVAEFIGDAFDAISAVTGADAAAGKAAGDWFWGRNTDAQGNDMSVKKDFDQAAYDAKLAGGYDPITGKTTTTQSDAARLVNAHKGNINATIQDRFTADIKGGTNTSSDKVLLVLQALAAALSNLAKQPTGVHIDGDKVAHASAQAARHRRHP